MVLARQKQSSLALSFVPMVQCRSGKNAVMNCQQTTFNTGLHRIPGHSLSQGYSVHPTIIPECDVNTPTPFLTKCPLMWSLERWVALLQHCTLFIKSCSSKNVGKLEGKQNIIQWSILMA